MENLKLRAQPPPLAGQKVRWADRVLESIEALHNDEDGKDAQDSSDTDGDSDADCEEAITPPPLTSDNQMCLEVADSTLDDQEYREVFTDLEAAEDLALKRFPSGSTQSPNGPLDKNIQVVVVELESDLADVETF